MKKRNARASLILSSLAAIGVAGSLMAGATYALFTSESSVNIAVQSGKVDVKATIEDLKTFSGKELVGNVDEDESKIVPTTAENVFENGGTATIDGGKLTLDRMTPGDRVTFEIKVKNNSDVSAKYRTKIMCDDGDGLFEGLKMTLNEQSYYGRTTISDYAELSAGSNPEKISVMIELPSDAGNEYQGKSCSISISVEAVQGNAATTDPEDGVFEIYTVSDLRYLQKNSDSFGVAGGTECDTVRLMNDIDLAGKEWFPIEKGDIGNGMTFDGNEKTIKNFFVDKTKEEPKTDYEKQAGFFGNLCCSTVTDLYIDNATIKGINGVGGIAGVGMCTTFTNCKVTNSTLIAEDVYKTKDADKVGSIVGRLTCEPGGGITGCEAENNTLQGYRDVGGLTGMVGYYERQLDKVDVTNNSVKDIKIINDRSFDYKGFDKGSDSAANLDDIVGRKERHDTDEYTVDESNTAENVTYRIQYVDGLSRKVRSSDNSVWDFEISNANGLSAWRDLVNNPAANDMFNYKAVNVSITNDITLEGTWEPINWGWGTAAFTLEGNEHTITGLNVQREDKYGAGFFSYLHGGKIQNLYFDDATVIGSENVGVLAGYSYGSSITNVKVTGSEVIANSKGGTWEAGYYAGGIVGGLLEVSQLDNTIKNCSVTDTEITGYCHVGSLAGAVTVQSGTTEATVPTIEGNTISGVTLYRDKRYNHKNLESDDAYFVSELVGWNVGLEGAPLFKIGDNGTPDVTIQDLTD